jgi:hypothetical protein
LALAISSMKRSRILFLVLAPVLFGSIHVGRADAADPAAAFTSPAPGVISVVRTSSFHVAWTLTAGAQVTSSSLAVQASRPIGTDGCDPRWAPFSVQSVSGTSFDVQGLARDHCYRFVLLLTTPRGPQSIASAPVIPTSKGWGPGAEFTNPYVDGVVSYTTSVQVGWIEWDAFKSPIVSRTLAEQSAPANGESCSGVSWSSGISVAFTGTAVTRTLDRARCYRYSLVLQDAAGFRSVSTSGALRIAANLPTWTGTLNLYRGDAYVTQFTLTQCVAASSQIMLNLTLGLSDTSSARQSTYMAFAEANDGASYSGGGSNPTGWAAVMNRYGGVPYSVARYIDSGSAIKAAATRLRLTNRPVGLLVFRGRHAWVLNGFEATADPAVTSSFTVTAVYVSGPLYPRKPNTYGYDPPPNTRLTTSEFTSSFFGRYYDPSRTTWNGYWIIIQP